MAAVAQYVEDMTAVFANCAKHMLSGAPLIIVIDDARDLYETILHDAELDIEERRKRHVNRRTGRRQGQFFEDIIVARVR